MQSSHTPILIAGAGPVGCTLAVELARYGVPFRLVDKAAGPTDQSRALGLETRTMELLHRLGAGEDSVGASIGRAARVMRGIKAYGAGGKLLADMPLSIDPAISRYPTELVLPQGQTQRLLLDQLGRFGAQAEFGVELVELEPHGEPPQTLLRRTDGAEERVSADWVIGADGATSLVRRIAGDNFIGAEYPEKFLLADVDLQWPLEDDHAHLFLRHGGPIIAFPFPAHGHWRLIDTSDEAETGEEAPTLERFRRLFGAVVPGMAIGKADWTSLFTIHRRLVERYRVGRVLLMGDAAHIHSPASGQGLNTGVQDAVNLGWKLALVVKRRAPHTLLDSYMQERRPVAESVLHDTDAMTKAVLADNPVVEHVRDWLAHVGLGFQSVQHRLALDNSKTRMSYRGSPIVSEWGHGLGHAPGPGDRMPDLELSPGVRLSDQLGGDPLAHHLLVFGADGALTTRLQEAVQSRSLSELVAIQPADGMGDPVMQAFGADRRAPRIVLVRPDLYVGFRAAGNAGLAEAFAQALDRVFTGAQAEPSRPGPGVQGYGTAD